MSRPHTRYAAIYLCACLFSSYPAAAEESFSPARSATVTSVQKCLDQLDPADAADIRARYVHPYQECQKRLRLKLEHKKQAEAKAAAETPVAPTPRNFVRVKKAAPEEKQDAQDAVAAPDKPKETYRDR
jgi:hypothetical protein